jgi:hypothetical protein
VPRTRDRADLVSHFQKMCCAVVRIMIFQAAKFASAIWMALRLNEFIHVFTPFVAPAPEQSRTISGSSRLNANYLHHRFAALLPNFICCLRNP